MSRRRSRRSRRAAASTFAAAATDTARSADSRCRRWASDRSWAAVRRREDKVRGAGGDAMARLTLCAGRSGPAPPAALGLSRGLDRTQPFSESTASGSACALVSGSEARHRSWCSAGRPAAKFRLNFGAEVHSRPFAARRAGARGVIWRMAAADGLSEPRHPSAVCRPVPTPGGW